MRRAANTSYKVYVIFVLVMVMQYYQRLKDLRNDKELKQYDIAQLLNTTQQQYSKYETGAQKIPARHVIDLLRNCHPEQSEGS